MPADQVVAADDYADDLLGPTDSVFDDAPDELDRTALDVNHCISLPLMFGLFTRFPDPGTDANVLPTWRTSQVESVGSCLIDPGRSEQRFSGLKIAV